MVKLEQNGAAAGQPYKPTTMFDDDEPDAELDSILRMTSSTHPASLSFEMEVQQHKQPRAKWYHAAFHSVCAVVGAGVLGLPYAISYLGWAGGLSVLTALTLASMYTSYLLAALHEGHDGRRLNDYQAMGRAVLGRRVAAWTVAPVQNVLLVGLCITYSVAAGQSLKGLLGAECAGAGCAAGITPWILGFAALELAASQLPDIHAIWWVSLIGAAMSLAYTAIAGVVSCVDAARGAGQGREPGPGREQSAADAVFGVLNALGSIGFTFGGQGVLPEIQATLAVPPGQPSTLRPMMISVGVAYIVVIAAYYSVGVGGYAAYGTAVAPDVLLSLGGPVWLRRCANAAVVAHMAAAYQVFAQPVFALMEGAIAARRRPAVAAVGPSVAAPAPHSAAATPRALRLAVRSGFVAAVTLVAVLVPFFAEVMGIIASLGLIPMTFVLPCVMWLVSQQPRGAERALNYAIAGGCGVLAILALIGSTRNVIVQLKLKHG
ncbi:hypothetical protein ACKKBG_A27570 [Auxenochlorella protothecoides x Auxenochlorella symbiontica]|uniref:Lysine histidine transporter 1 n=1 Tax=Auxenochlorella protothecoides TaxID=3075 RepID=A0A087SGP5_AUXPR|nr:Lysine histidine transporter 1 [Auxenochlorella protothecoides]KFM24899.1 Lysine histidine transporter 1 [Auxenochlorella protothecoides]